MASQGSGRTRKRKQAERPEGAALSPREHRQRAGISLDAIAESSKICRRHLEAIEDGRFDRLPGGVFSTSYIRQYAEATGYDVDEILSRYRLSQDEPTADRREEPRQSAASGSLRWTKFFSLG